MTHCGSRCISVYQVYIRVACTILEPKGLSGVWGEGGCAKKPEGVSPAAAGGSMSGCGASLHRSSTKPIATQQCGVFSCGGLLGVSKAERNQMATRGGMGGGG